MYHTFVTCLSVNGLYVSIYLASPLSKMSSRRYADLSCRNVSMLLCDVVGDPMIITQPKSWETWYCFLFLVKSLQIMLHSPSSLALELNVLTFRSSASFMRWHLVAGGEVCPTHRRQELHKVHIYLCLELSDWA